MSTDRSRLVSSIRRIVLTDPDLSSALDAWQNRGDQASSTGTGTSDAERDRLCCDGSTSDNPNPGADTRDTSEGGQDGLNDDDPALLDSGPGSLTGVTDCATGEPICFDGNDWLPPEGWDDPTEPPLTVEYSDADAPCDVLSYPAPDPDNHQYSLAGWFPESGGTGPLIRISVPSCDGHPPAPSGWTYPGVSCETIQIEDCDGGPFNGNIVTQRTTDEFSEPQEQPGDTTWPADGCTNLAIKNGTIVGSKYDPENDGTYSKPMSEIELCDEFGNSFFLSPASNGGWKTIDSTKTDGYLYDSQGNKIAHIDGNEYSDPDV